MAESHSIQLIRLASEMTESNRAARKRDLRIGLVPTMGALHEGHLELIRRIAEEVDHVVVSIFVNPTQFGPKEDFEAYPRVLEDDLALLEAQGKTHAVFAPSARELYPFDRNLTWVIVDELGDHLCGAARPGHFRGVTTIVSRLFTICEPDTAAFGLKDAQQFFILKRMASEMGFPVDLLGVPTVREEDGLAMSSRNRYLSPAHRRQATVLHDAVSAAKRLVDEGVRSTTIIEETMREAIAAAPDAELDYARVVETRRLQPIGELEEGIGVLAAVAVFFGNARLIDNAIVDIA